MIDYQLILEKQFSYVTDIFLSRKDSFSESFEKPLFPSEPSAAEVYIHGLSSFYKSCVNLIAKEGDNSLVKFEMNKNLDLPSQYLELYENTIQIFKQVQQKMANEDLNTCIAFPLNPEKTISILEWISLNVTHTVSHVAQAIRLQALFFRNKSE